MPDRRPNRRSSIYVGKDGRWHGWVTVGIKEDGSLDRRHRSGGTEAEVTRKVRELERHRDSGQVASACPHSGPVDGYMAHDHCSAASPTLHVLQHVCAQGV